MKTIIANPPFSVNWSADPTYLNDDRFKEYEKLAPKSKADYAFIQDMVHHLADNGVMSVVLPHGVLFRGSAEGHIRRWLIEKMNVLDAVVGLPANIFFGTSIPTCILMFRKNRQVDDGILFIDASSGFEKAKNKNLLKEEHIEKIVNTYQNKTAIEKYSYLASIDEVLGNDYNLNIPRYVDTFEEEEEIDIKAVMSDIKKLEQKRDYLDLEIEGYFKELGL